MALVDKTSLINRACAVIGANPIDALDEDTPGAQIAALRYDSLLEAMIGLPVAWSFALRTLECTRLSDPTLLSGWSYAYGLPAQRIGEVVKISDVADDPDRHFTRFSQEGAYVLANAETLYARVKVIPTIADMSGPFRIAFETGLAAALAMGLASDKDMHDQLWDKAFGPPSMSMLGGLCGAAAQANKAAMPTRGPMTHYDPLTSAWRG